ncbi:hypothetical protein IAT38_005499 [Cryptococcus sp. DSM 104549]
MMTETQQSALSSTELEHTIRSFVAATCALQSKASPSNATHASPTPRPGTPPVDSGAKAARRSKTGCITCRLRKKRCDEAKPTCATCERLGVECMGYGARRPEWLREKENAAKAKKAIKDMVMYKRFKKEGSDPDSPTLVDDGTRSHGERSRSLGSEEGTVRNGVTLVSPSELSASSLHGTVAPGDIHESVEPVQRSKRKRTVESPEDEMGPITAEEATLAAGSAGDLGEADRGADDAQELEGIAGGTAGGVQSDQTWTGMGLDPWGLLGGATAASTGLSLAAMALAHAAREEGTNVTGASSSGPAVDYGLNLVPSSGAAGARGEGEIDSLWASLFNTSTGDVQWGPVPPPVAPSPSDATPPFFTMPSPSVGLSLTNGVDLRYVHHYLNVVLPLQYRMLNISISMSDFVAPLAFSISEVFDSVSSLAALHLVSQRTKKRLQTTLPASPTSLAAVLGDHGYSPGYGGGSNVATIEEIHDDDAVMAVSSHRKSVERLRFLSPQDLTTEGVILSALFAISYHLFSGGTSRHLQEMISITQRCLSAALASCPEFADEGSSKSSKTYLPEGSPWRRYRPLVEHMIWTDIISSVSQNKASRLLPTYRKLLKRLPSESSLDNKPVVQMDKVMGSDSTTLLAIAEIVALAEWKEREEKAGSLSYNELVERAGAIKNLLDERAWRESHLDGRPGSKDTEEDRASEDLRRIMTDVFYGSAKVLLAITVNGPYPKVPEVAQGVQDTLEALNRLEIEHADADIHRALVLPITVAGCYCYSPSQQAFFRSCFDRLSPEARAFGNTAPALELMEEVWKRRAAAKGPGVGICWRDTMAKMGWESGILLI